MRPCAGVFAFVWITCGVMVTPPPVNLAAKFGIGLNVILLFTSVTGVFDADVATLRAVTVRALFLLIAATASFVASIPFVPD